MAISKKLVNFLKKEKAKYKDIEHKTVYTAYDKSQTLKVPEKIIGKTLVIKMDRNYAIALISADQIFDKVKFKKAENLRRKMAKQKPIKKIDFVSETWMKKNLKGVKVGATPPFGNLWGLPTFVDKSLLKNRKIIVSGGDYNFSIEISLANLKKLIPGLITGNISKKRK